MILHTWLDVLICEWAGFLCALVSVILCWFKCPWYSGIILQREGFRKRSWSSKEQDISPLSLPLGLPFWLWQEWEVALLVFSPSHGWGSSQRSISIHGSPSLPPLPGQSALLWPSYLCPLPPDLYCQIWDPHSPCPALCGFTACFLSCQRELGDASLYDLYRCLLLFGGKANTTATHAPHLPIWALKDLVKIGDKISYWTLRVSYSTIGIQTKMYLTRKEFAWTPLKSAYDFVVLNHII